MLFKFKELVVKMSINVYYFFSHLYGFPANFGELTEEHGERFHQNIKAMEERHHDRWDAHTTAGCCWSL